MALSARAFASESGNNRCVVIYSSSSYVLRGHRSLLSLVQTHPPLHQMILPQHLMALGSQLACTEIMYSLNRILSKIDVPFPGPN